MKFTWTISVGSEEVILMNEIGEHWSWDMSSKHPKDNTLPRAIQCLLSKDIEAKELKLENIRNRLDKLSVDDMR